MDDAPLDGVTAATSPTTGFSNVSALFSWPSAETERARCDVAARVLPVSDYDPRLDLTEQEIERCSKTMV